MVGAKLSALDLDLGLEQIKTVVFTVDISKRTCGATYWNSEDLWIYLGTLHTCPYNNTFYRISSMNNIVYIYISIHTVADAGEVLLLIGYRKIKQRVTTMSYYVSYRIYLTRDRLALKIFGIMCLHCAHALSGNTHSLTPTHTPHKKITSASNNVSMHCTEFQT